MRFPLKKKKLVNDSDVVVDKVKSEFEGSNLNNELKIINKKNYCLPHRDVFNKDDEDLNCLTTMPHVLGKGLSSSSEDISDSECLGKENANTLCSNKSSFNRGNATVKEHNQILGLGHLSILHAFVRDQLFKKIKILSNNHLETSGSIMKECFKKLQFQERINGNMIAFSNACRTEIRKTMCSRRGYVKRQIGILLTGKFTAKIQFFFL